MLHCLALTQLAQYQYRVEVDDSSIGQAKGVKVIHNYGSGGSVRTISMYEIICCNAMILIFSHDQFSRLQLLPFLFVVIEGWTVFVGQSKEAVSLL